jgi:hypothetical protein
MNVTIPNALHICPGCEALCSGTEYCARCREEIASIGDFHAARAAQFYGALKRESGVMPESGKLGRAQQEAARRLARIGFAVLMLGVWLWMAADIYTRCRH